MRLNRERGEGNFGCLVGIVVLLIALFVAFKMIPVKIKAAEVREVLQDEAKSAGTHDDAHITKAILAKAKDDGLPITESNIKISHQPGAIKIELSYVLPIEFPG